MSDKTLRTWLIITLAVACVLRAGLILSIKNPQDVPRTVHESDAPTYYVLADNLLSGIGYRYGEDLQTQAAPAVPLGSLLTPGIKAQLESSTEVQRDSILRSDAVRLILANKREAAADHLVLIGFGIYGLTRIPRGIRYLTLVPVTTIVFSSLMYLAVSSVVRFVVPLVSLLLPYSAIGFVAVVRRSTGDAQ